MSLTHAERWRPKGMFFQPMRRKYALSDRVMPSGGLVRLFYLLERFQVGLFSQAIWGRYRDSFRVFEADVLVIGANPFLNALAAVSAVRKGQKVIIGSLRVPDEWSYGLLRHTGFRAFIEKAFGMEDVTGLPRSEINATASSMGLVRDADAAAFDEVFGAISSQMAAMPRGSAGLVPDGFGYVLSVRRAGDESVVYLRRQENAPEGAMSSDQRACFDAFSVALRPHVARLDLPPVAPGIENLDCIFARSVVLTSPIPDFAPTTPEQVKAGDVLVRSDNPYIRMIGTARRAVVAREDMLRRAIEDVMAAAALAAEQDRPVGGLRGDP